MPRREERLGGSRGVGAALSAGESLSSASDRSARLIELPLRERAAEGGELEA